MSGAPRSLTLLSRDGCGLCEEFLEAFAASCPDLLPVLTVADDILPFRGGPLRFKMRVEYLNYQKFGSDTVIRFDPPPSEEKKP